ncbi:MAG: nucleotidyl cyclase domain-containing protein [Vulcanimicrobiaceae bacterium]
MNDRTKLRTLALLTGFTPLLLVVVIQLVLRADDWWMTLLATVVGAAALTVTLDRITFGVRLVPHANSPEQPTAQRSDARIVNREVAMSALRERVERADHFTPLCVALVDVSRIGDLDTESAGGVIRKTLREHDWATNIDNARYLVALQTHHNADRALARLRSCLSDVPSRVPIGYTMSIQGDTIDDLLERAESALAKALEIGGDTLVAAET